MSDRISASIIIEDSHGSSQFSVDALLAGEGKLFLCDDIDSETAAALISSMIYLADNGKEIKLYINSNGGEVKAGLMLVDVITLLQKKVHIDVICIGKAYSMAAIILAVGGKGNRYLLPHAEVMIHEPLIQYGAGGSASSVKNTAEALMSVRDSISDILSECTGKAAEKINEMMSHDTFFNAEEAIEFGIADAVITEL